MFAAMWDVVISYLKFALRVKNAHRVHSPFVFDFYTDVILSKRAYYAFKEIDRLRAQLLIEEELIEDSDPGAGSHTNKKKQRIQDMARNAAVSKGYGELLFRICERLKPARILELGTSLGISTSYMAYASKSEIHSIEGRKQLAERAKKLFKNDRTRHVTIHSGLFEDVLPLPGMWDLVYVDGNHTYEATLSVVKQLIPNLHQNSLIIIDDIRWSAGMWKAWEELCQMDEFHVSIDVLRMGFLFTRPFQTKEHFTLYPG